MSRVADGLAELRSTVEAAHRAAPGKWRWWGTVGRPDRYGRNHNTLILGSFRPGLGMCTAFGFERAGMSGALPVFSGDDPDDYLLVSARKAATYEVEYRDDVVGFDNAVATFMAAADPETVLGLIDEVEVARSGDVTLLPEWEALVEFAHGPQLDDVGYENEQWARLAAELVAAVAAAGRGHG